MADLTGTTPANTYKGLLQVNDYTDGVAGNTGSNALVIQDGAGNATALAISTDNVGIGTTSPEEELHIEGSNAPYIKVEASDDSDAGVAIAKQGGNKWFILNDADASDNFAIRGDGGGTDEFLTITQDGNIGIGTTSPASKLHLKTTHSDTNAIDNLLILEAIEKAGQDLQPGDGLGILFKVPVGNDQTSAVGARIAAVKEGGTEAATSTELVFEVSQEDETLDEAMRIDRDGNVGIGSTSPSAKLDVNGDIRMSDFELVQSGQTGIFRPYVDSRNCFIYSRDASSASKGAGIDFGNGFAFRPSDTATQNLGTATKKWNDIHAVNATIQTSDRELKQDIEELSEAETRVAQACKGLLRKYRWKSSVEEKGDEARIHFGIIAQDLEAAFAAEGLDAGRYGMFVKNTWWTADRVIPAVEAVEAVEAVYDEEDNIVSPAVEAVEAQPEKTVTDIFNNSEDAPEGATEVTQRGVRYSELLAFIIAAI